jgi:predicted nucleic acid-binding protein
VNRPRVFLDSCILVEDLVASWSSSRGVLILGRSALLTFVLAEIVIEETGRALARKIGPQYGGRRQLRDDFKLLLERLIIERVPHVSRSEFDAASKLIRHRNDVPVLAAALNAKPDWLLSSNTAHFSPAVAKRTALRITTPADFLDQCARILR